MNLLLEHFGGHHPRVRAGWVEVCRPGKDDGASATVGRLGAGVVKVWSSNWPGLPAGVYGGHELRKLAGVNEPKVHAPGDRTARRVPMVASRGRRAGRARRSPRPPTTAPSAST